MHALLGCCFHHDTCCAADTPGHAECGSIHDDHVHAESGHQHRDGDADTTVDSAASGHFGCCSGHQDQVSMVTEATLSLSPPIESVDFQACHDHSCVNSLQCDHSPTDDPQHCDGAHCVSLVEPLSGGSTSFMHDSAGCFGIGRHRATAGTGAWVNRTLAADALGANGPQALYCRWQI